MIPKSAKGGSKWTKNLLNLISSKGKKAKLIKRGKHTNKGGILKKLPSPRLWVPRKKMPGERRGKMG